MEFDKNLEKDKLFRLNNLSKIGIESTILT